MINKIEYLFILTICLFSCTNQNDAKNSLESMDFNNIEYTGYNFFACSNEDFYHTGFIATNQHGKKVIGTVCSGIFFKNSTVRFK